MSKDDDAIDPDDVSAEEAESAGEQDQSDQRPRYIRERDKALSEIARQNEELHGIEREESEEIESEEPERPSEDEEYEAVLGDHSGEEESEDQPEGEQQDQSDPLSELGYYRKSDGKLYTTMKINGEEREVEASQVKAYIQKDLAGDRKLQQAAEKERRLKEMEELVNQRQEQLQQSAASRPSEVDAEEARKQAKEVLDKIWDGDEDAAAEALAGYLQKGVDPEQISAAAEQRALSAVEQREKQREQQEWEQSVDDGNRALMNNYPDIYEDQRLFDLVNSETARMVERHQAGDPEFANMTPSDMIDQAARSVNEWMNGKGVKSQRKSGDESQTSSRRQRKRNLKPMPRSRDMTPPEKQGEQEIDTSPEAVIERMRARRAAN